MATTTSNASSGQPRSAEESQKDEFTAMLATLPVHTGWHLPLMYQYRGVWFYPERLADALQWQEHFKPRESDLLLATLPKVGTTWLKALAFAIANRKQFSFLDHPLLSSLPHELVPTLDVKRDEDVAEQYPTTARASIFHTHLPYALLPGSVRKSSNLVVYVCRNARDTFVSMWKFFCKLRTEEMGVLPLEEAFGMFCSGVSSFGPYWDHVLGYWEASQERPDKVLFLKYEELQRDQAFHVKRMARFLGFPFSAEEEKEGVVEQIMKLCSFENLSSLEVNKTGEFLPKLSNRLFFREGKVGDSAKYLADEMVERLNSITEQKFKGSGLEKF